MARDHAQRADFLCVYIAEAHPTDEWQMTSNEKDDVCYAQPTTLAERQAIARDFSARHPWSVPLLVDRMDNRADQLYAAWPERLYVIGADGTIAYKGGPGPFEFEPEELEAWLAARP